MYNIQRTEFVYNAAKQACLIRDETLFTEYSYSVEANNKIKDYAEAWRKESTLIQHHAGQSVVFFPDGYIEFTRSPSR